ncbi:MAG: outer membrane lipoprotein carrier protein LolA [Planctomycetota bacterium]
MKWIENLSGTGLALSLLIAGCATATTSAEPAAEAPPAPPPPPPPASQPATQPDDEFDPAYDAEEEAETEEDDGFFGINVPMPGEVRPRADEPHNTPEPDPAPPAPPAEAAPPVAPVAAEAGPDIEPQALAVLKTLEAQSELTDTLTARLTYDKVQGLFGQEQRRFGDFWYSADQPNPRFAVRFDGLRIGGHGKPLTELDEWYIFDGQWLLEKDQRKKNATRRELVGPDEPLDLLSTDGLPLPLQIDADEIAERFAVTLKRHDARATILELIPRQRDPEQGAQSVELMFLPSAEDQQLTPRRVLIKEANGDQTSVTLSSVERNGDVAEARFDTEPDLQAMRGWDVQVLPLERGVEE